MTTETPAGRRRSHKRTGRGIKRTIIIMVVMVLGLVSLIALAAQRKPIVLMPPEPPELVAKRANKADNAVYAFTQAAMKLPPMLGRVPMLDSPPAGSVAALVGTQLADDDPQLLAYVGGCADAMVKVREGLSKPYFLMPNSNMQYDGRGVMERLAQPFWIHALLRSRTAELDAMTLEFWLDALRFGQKLGEDGHYFASHSATGIQTKTLSLLPWLTRRATSEDLLRNLLRVLQERPDMRDSAVRSLESQWRLLDQELFSTGGHKSPERRAEEFIERMYWGRGIGRQKTLILANQPEFRDMVQLPYHEFRARVTDEFPAVLSPGGRWSGYYEGLGLPINVKSAMGQVIAELAGIAHRHSTLETMYRGAEIVCALDLYRLAHGSYPENLEALVPESLSSVPIDVLSGASFVYKRSDDTYALYSIGTNAKDEGGDTRRGRDLPIHMPPEPVPAEDE